MKNIIYLTELLSPDLTKFESNFQCLFDLVNSISKAEVVRTIRDLGRRLNHERYDIGLLLLFARNRSELFDLIEMQKDFLDFKIVLIVPDQEKETLGLGHKLYPRFMANINDDPAILESVVEKMMNNLNQSFLPLVRETEDHSEQFNEIQHLTNIYNNN